MSGWPFRLAYNTNGLAHHRPLEALELVAQIGYGGLAITPDVGALDPLAPDLELLRALSARAAALDVRLAVETGARFLLDPRVKHGPSLLDADARQRSRRLDLLMRCADIAAELGATVLSIWSGAEPSGARAERDGSTPAVESAWERLTEAIERLLGRTQALGIELAFEPEPGMFVERPAGYAELVRRLGAQGSRLGLSLDVAHLLCTGDLPVARVIAEFAPMLRHVSIADIAGGVHEHRMFGEGELDVHEALTALSRANFRGLVAVELSRDSHRGAWAAQEAWKRLQAARPRR